jgi:hypothetical protein
MSRAEKLVHKACANSGSLTFGELVRLVGLFGYHQVRQGGSHRIFARGAGHRRFNFQDADGKAKVAQVREFLDHARAQGWIAPNEEDQ